MQEPSVRFEWSPGFALVQKRKSIASLHAAAVDQLDVDSLLEVSTKSPKALGARLSAFNLHIRFDDLGRRVPLESAFQGSKVFEQSGQRPEIYEMSSGTDAKKAARAYESEKLVKFSFEGRNWPLTPKTAFYDWLYVRALVDLAIERPSLVDELLEFEGFTDIEFNPRRSFNCQARSCALFVALSAWTDLGELVGNPDEFLAILEDRRYGYPEEPPTLI